MSNRTAYQSFRAYRDSVFDILSTRAAMVVLTILPVLSLFLLINIAPIVWIFYASFHEIPLFSPVWEWNGITNYVDVLNSAEFWASMWKGVVFAVVSTSLQVVLGTGIALLINRDIKFAAVWRSVALLPYLIPTAVLGFIALWMGNSQFGIVNVVLTRLGIIESNLAWYGNPDLAMASVILVSSWKFTIFTTLLVLARLQSIPDGYYEAAQMAGASMWQQFSDITLPNLKGVIFIILLLRSIWMFNKFDIIYVLTSGGPGQATETVAVYAYLQAFVANQFGEVAAVSVILFVMLVMFAIIYFVVFEPESEVRVE